MWLSRIPMRKQIVASWHMCRGHSVEDISLCVHIHASTVYDIFLRFLDVVAAAQEHANAELIVEGECVECEADNIALRCVQGRNSIGQPSAWWLRYFGLVRRDSSSTLRRALHRICRPRRWWSAVCAGIAGCIESVKWQPCFGTSCNLTYR